MPKALPADTWNNLFYPPPGYKYFENSGQFDFDPGVRQFWWKNAWWLADASLLAYVKDWATVTATLASARFEDMQQIGPSAGKSTKGFFASRSGPAPFAIVAFRGTDKDDERNAITDADTVPVPRDGYTVHQGFAKALDQVWQSEVETMLADFLTKHPGACVYFTGHSLGAALATIAVTRFAGDNSALYTIGSPRVGDDRFVRAVFDKTKLVFRFVNSQDIVTQIPPGFEPVGLEKYIDRDGTIHDDPSPLYKFDDAAEGVLAHDGPALLNVIVDLEDYRQNVMLVGPWVDPPPYIVGNHTPARYSIRIWNFYSGQ
jgi:hypothetical protein